VEQGDGDLPLTLCLSGHAVMEDDRYNHAPNDSPRSGSTKKVTPMVWGAIFFIIVLLAVWFTMKA
jgi:hypothetical protein